MKKRFPLEAVEKLSVGKLRQLQLKRLRWSLEHAYKNVAHYRKKFGAAKGKPAQCKSLDDLSRFPFTTKADLRETYPFGMFAVPMDKIVRIPASSGPTGKPTVVGYTARNLAMWSDVMARSMRAAGARPGDKVHNAYGYGLFTGGLGAHYGAGRLRADRGPGRRRHDRASSATHRRLQAADHHGHAELHARHRRRDGAAGPRSEEELAAHRHVRRRAVDQPAEKLDREKNLPAGDRSLWPVRDHRPRGRLRVPRDQGRPHLLGRP